MTEQIGGLTRLTRYALGLLAVRPVRGEPPWAGGVLTRGFRLRPIHSGVVADRVRNRLCHGAVCSGYRAVYLPELTGKEIIIELPKVKKKPFNNDCSIV